MSAQPIPDSSPGRTLLAGERRVLELIATGAPLGDTLNTLCGVIDEQSGLMSSIFLLDRDGAHLSLAAAPHVPEAWRKATHSFRATPTAGACGAAVNRRAQVIVTDVPASPLFETWHEAARVSGIASAWSTPFLSEDGHVLGTFAVFDHERQSPSDAHSRLIDRATYLASIAVERHQTEQELRESERRFSAAFYAGPASMTIMRAADSRYLYVNDRFVTMFGYSRAEALGQTPLGLGLYAEPADRSALLALLDARCARNVDVKARTRSGQILDLLIWLEQIPLFGAECILGIACDITDRKRTEDELARSERLMRAVLETLPVGVKVVDSAGDILLSNPASQRIWGGVIRSEAERHARSKAWWHDTGKAVGPEEFASARARLKGETSIDEVLDIEGFDGVRRIIRNTAVPIRDAKDRITGAVVVNEDISGRKAAERELNDSFNAMRLLSGRLMRAQDDERRRIAQMLHETTAQDLAALKMQLARLSRTGAGLSEADRAVLTESIALAERSMSGIRTLSYLLHPPLLDESGLLAALRWYAMGFAERSGIKVDLDLPSTFKRLPQDVETALFRVVQEALLNIHHHAESPTALIRLRVDGPQLKLEIADRGSGMASNVIAQLPTGGGALGVGVAGMRERLQQLGGTLDIESSATGTTVRAQIPLPANAP
jgi:PAS domain S-box-containing protein